MDSSHDPVPSRRRRSKLFVRAPFAVAWSAFLTAALIFSTVAHAADADAGKAKAQSCAMCHGARGISQLPGAPNLAGQTAIYTTEQLKNFRSGKRTNEIMTVIAKPLSDADIAELAAWYESIKVTVAAE